MRVGAHCKMTLAACLLFPALFGAIMAAVPDVPDFFNVTDDLSKVTWAHAVNNRSLLEAALNGTTMMIEADVSYGRKIDGSKDEPIMAHPPHNTSDLSLEDFLNTVQNQSKVGIKVDFKSQKAFEEAVPLLTKSVTKLQVPLWINADILAGPVNASDPSINSTRFLSECKKNFSDVTLSLGWTTKYSENGVYSKELVQDMLDVLQSNKIEQRITFAVRAAFAVQSKVEMQTLVNETNGTLTLWGSRGDNVDAALYNDLITTLGKHKVYIDLPADIVKKITTSSANSAYWSPAATFISVFLLVKQLLL